MQGDDVHAASERFDAGEQIVQVDRSQIGHVWEAMSRIPIEARQKTAAIGVDVFGNSDLAPRTPEQQIALMARYALLDALIERGALNAYMSDESLRERVFAAAATIPCDKNDLGEVMVQRLLRESPPEVAQKVEQEMRQAGCDPDHPKMCDKFVEWMRDNC
jgi:hypothetical protein